MIIDGERKLTIKMKELLDDISIKQTAYESAQAGFDSAGRRYESSGRMYDNGMMGEPEYLKSEISYLQYKAAFYAAEANLRLAIETYQWAIKGLAEVE